MVYVQRTTQIRGSMTHVNVKDFCIEIVVWGEPPTDHHRTVMNFTVDEAKSVIRQMQDAIAILEAPRDGKQHWPALSHRVASDNASR